MKKDIAADADMIKRVNPKTFEIRSAFRDKLFNAPIPPEELLNNLPLFQDRRSISRILFLNEIYQRIVRVHGNIFELGVRYGPNLALFAALRGIYEPLNPNRKIVGFDTFEGFADIDHEHDLSRYKVGDYAVTERYEEYLAEVLRLHEAMGPLENMCRFELVKGDATKTVPAYLEKHPETVIALAYFDFDIYRPTKVCLEAILPYLTKGAVIVFDEINLPDFPGETVAFREVLGGEKFQLIHSPFRGAAAYLVYE